MAPVSQELEPPTNPGRFKPTVRFENGKATKATLNWSDIDGAILAKSAVWSTATLDNNLGVLEGATVDAINSFFGEKCDEVKAEYAKP